MSYRRKSTFAITVFALALLLTGCFNFGSKRPETPTPSARLVEGVILAPSAIEPQVSAAESFFDGLRRQLGMTAQAQSIFVPLVGAKVIALEVPSLKEIPGVVGETDANGRYSLTLTGLRAGQPIIVVATKTLPDERVVRMSTFVEAVRDRTVADVDVATTLATEQLASRMAESTVTVPDDWWAELWETAHAAAENIVRSVANDPDELARMVAVGEGVLKGRIGDGLDEYADDIPLPDDSPDEGYELLARAMVQALRDAGYGLATTLEGHLNNYAQRIIDEVVPHWGDFGFAMSRLIEVAGVVQQRPEGGKFQVVRSNAGVELVDLASGPSGTWDVELWEGGTRIDSYRIVQQPGAAARYTLTSSSRDRLDISFPDPFLWGQDASFELDGTITLDSGAEVVFEGVSMSVAFRPEMDYAVQEIAIHGRINSDVFGLYGEMSLEAVDDVAHCLQYDNPTLVDCASIFQRLTIKGELSLLGSLQGYSQLQVAVEEYDFGSWTGDWGYPAAVKGTLRIDSGWLETGVSDPLSMSGTLQANWDSHRPGMVSGTYVAISYVGEVKAPGRAPMRVDITVEPDGSDALRSQILYELGSYDLRGTGRVSNLRSVPSVELTLEDPNGLELHISYSGSGSADGYIRHLDSGQDLAKIEISPAGGVEVRYLKSGDIESLF